MQRLNIRYTIAEEEYEEELVRLMKSSEEYIANYSTALSTATGLLEAGNHDGCMKALSDVRDALALADFRLHDAMVLLAGYLQEKAAQNPDPPADTPSPHPEAASPAHPHPVDTTSFPTPPPEIDLEAMEQQTAQFNDRMIAARENIKKLGINVSDDELENLLGGANDTVS